MKRIKKVVARYIWTKIYLLFDLYILQGREREGVV